MRYTDVESCYQAIIDTIQPIKLIFVAHSLGGVVVKSVEPPPSGALATPVMRIESNIIQALIDAARHGSQHRWLLEQTTGIVFLGTPHQGSSIADKAAFLGKFAKFAGLKLNKEILASLKRNSDGLFEKAEQFRDICGKIKISSFYETIAVVLLGQSSLVISLFPFRGTGLTYLFQDGREILSVCRRSRRRIYTSPCGPSKYLQIREFNMSKLETSSK
jgi:hypothetical protein